MTILKVRKKGSDNLDLSFTAPAGQWYELVCITLNMSAAPTTSENFTVTYGSGAHPDYNTQIYALDLSTGSTTDLVFADGLSGWRRVVFGDGDSIDVDFTNTDIGTYAAEMTVKAI